MACRSQDGQGAEMEELQSAHQSELRRLHAEHKVSTAQLEDSSAILM